MTTRNLSDTEQRLVDSIRLVKAKEDAVGTTPPGGVENDAADQGAVVGEEPAKSVPPRRARSTVATRGSGRQAPPQAAKPDAERAETSDSALMALRGQRVWPD